MINATFPISSSSSFKPRYIKINSCLEPNYKNIISQLSAELKISQISAEILINRGVKSPQEARAFLNPTLRNDLPDPASLKNATAVTDCISQAIASQKYITIFSDFDVDGISSASQLWLILKQAGAKLRYYVPNRMKEGYGLSESAVRKLQEEKTNLLITLDCGITNINEISLAKELGLEVIVIDHHEIGTKIPPADYIINPMQEDCGFYGQKLCTAGIVWLLGILLCKELKKLDSHQTKDIISSKDLLDLAAIGTICDMVPLRGVNRLIASRGIDSIKDNPRPGIQAIQEVAQIPQGDRFTCSSIAFGIGPRLNAAGRLEDASTGMSLLISESLNEAKSLAIKINNLNTERKTLEDNVKSACIKLAGELKETHGQLPFAYTLYDDSFHVGVIGIAAQRMVESLCRPTAVLGKSDKSENAAIIKGSVRSIGGFHVADALSKLSHLLISHGGHKEAGGFSIEKKNIEHFREEFNNLAKLFFGENEPHQSLSVEKEISFSDINIQLVKELELFSPFGIGNPSPLFLTKGVEISHIQIIGTNHVKLELYHNKKTRNALAWRMLGHPLLEQGNFIDIVYSLEINTYKGISSVQLILKEISK